MTETKRFPLRVVLTVTTGRLLTKPKGDRDNGIGDLYAILGHMTNDSPFTHQLPRFGAECEAWLLRWFPELERADAMAGHLDAAIEGARASGRDAVEQAVAQWVAAVAKVCDLKAEYDVPRIPADDHERKHPYDELVAMRGTDKGVVVVEIPEAEE